MPNSGVHRILVIDDEPSICAMLGDVLREDGYEPISATGDVEAYRRLETESSTISALVVDINLGRGTTGFDIARYARRLNPEFPVIYITGASHTLETHGVEGGVLVTKPFDRDLLLATLREKLPSQSRPQSTAP